MSTSATAGRAPRFPLQFPFIYRCDGTTQWQSGRVENVSCSGIFFRGRGLFEKCGKLEFLLQLPKEICGPVVLRAMGLVQVARVEPAGEDVYVGAAFLNFQLLQGENVAGVPLQAFASGCERPALSNAAHELGNAVTIILGMCDLLLHRMDLAEGVHQSLLQIKAAAQRIKAIARDLEKSIA